MTARAVQDGLFQVDPPGLLGTRCEACGNHAFPQTAVCPYCGSASVTHVVLSANGTLWLWTTVSTPPPGYLGSVPFGFGVVELPEGVRVITRLGVPDDSFVEGLPVSLQIVPLHVGDDGVMVETWEFAP
jgi:scaffold protein (connect acetoacetyl-CoA thiolase and HMG-CoA synthase)